MCEAGNEHYEVGKLVVGNNTAANVAHNREFTSREQDVAGEKYPAATLKDLGISTAPKTKKGKKK